MDEYYWTKNITVMNKKTCHNHVYILLLVPGLLTNIPSEYSTQFLFAKLVT